MSSSARAHVVVGPATGAGGSATLRNLTRGDEIIVGFHHVKGYDTDASPDTSSVTGCFGRGAEAATARPATSRVPLFPYGHAIQHRQSDTRSKRRNQTDCLASVRRTPSKARPAGLLPT